MTAANATGELEFPVAGKTYRAGRLSTFDQLHVASQWRDVLLGLALAKRDRPRAISDATYMEAVGVVTTGGLGRLSTEVREEVTRLALSVVTRREGDGWASVTTPDGTLCFDDIRLPQLIPILYAVFDHNGILDFFSGSPSTSDGPAERPRVAGSSSRAARAG